VAVPSLGEVDVEALHPLEPSPHVKVGPVEDIPHVEVPARVRRGRVDAVTGTGIVLPVVCVYSSLFPERLPFLLVLEEINFSWKSIHIVHPFFVADDDPGFE
jgi:hypothetical protein